MLDLTVLDATVAEIANIGTINNRSEWLAFSFAAVCYQYGLAYQQLRHQSRTLSPPILTLTIEKTWQFALVQIHRRPLLPCGP